MDIKCTLGGHLSRTDSGKWQKATTAKNVFGSDATKTNVVVPVGWFVVVTVGATDVVIVVVPRTATQDAPFSDVPPHSYVVL